MISYSPSGALSPYYYKGGYFHGIHYGSYFNDMNGLFDMIEKEEKFILNSPQQRRILMDFYETNLSPEVLKRIMLHIEYLKPRIVKLAIATDKKSLKEIRKVMKKDKELQTLCCYFCTDMEEGKTWLVSDEM